MTSLTWWNDSMNFVQHYELNGCLWARVTEHELVEESTMADAIRLARDRVTALVWLAMPCHDDDASTRKDES